MLLSAQRVGPTGIAYGLDMTDEMLELARRNAAAAGATNAVFLKGEIEAIPLPDASVDVVISNCVINLSPDKPRVFAEIARVLRPDGRVSVCDVVAEDPLTPADRAERGDHVGCIAGALSFTEYAEGLAGAGLDRIELLPTHRAVDGMYNVIVRAVRPLRRDGADTTDAAAVAAAAGLAAARPSDRRERSPSATPAARRTEVRAAADENGTTATANAEDERRPHGRGGARGSLGPDARRACGLRRQQDRARLPRA